MKPITHVLVSTDFSAASRAAIEAAATIAKSFGAKLTLLHAVESQYAAYAGMPFMPVVNLAAEVEEAAQAGLERDAAALGVDVKVASVLRRGSAWQQIIEGAKECGADLIVMGTHGHTGLARALIGSTAEKVVRMSTVPVLTVHAP